MNKLDKIKKWVEENEYIIFNTKKYENGKVMTLHLSNGKIKSDHIREETFKNQKKHYAFTIDHELVLVVAYSVELDKVIEIFPFIKVDDIVAHFDQLDELKAALENVMKDKQTLKEYLEND